MGHADRRRAEALHPHGRGLRRLHLVLRRPPRQGARLPRGVRRARQHPDRRHLGQRRQRRGRSQRQLQRVALLQRCPRHVRDHQPPPRRARHPGVEQPLQHRVGLGTGHTVPVLEALGGCRGRHRRHVHGGLAGEDPGVRRDPPPVHPRGRHRADGLRPVGHRATGGDQGLRPERDRGRELRRRADRRVGARQADAVLHDARPALALPRRLVGLHRAPAAVELGQLRQGRVGAVPPRDRPVPEHERRGGPPRPARGAEGAVVLLRGHLQRSARGRPQRAGAGARGPAARSPGPGPVHLLPGCQRRARVGRTAAARALVHDRRRGGGRPPTTSRA